MADSIRAWLIQIEATRLVLDDVMAEDDYAEIDLTEDQLESIDRQYPEVEDTETFSIQSQPGCLKTARYKPAGQSGMANCIHATCLTSHRDATACPVLLSALPQLCGLC